MPALHDFLSIEADRPKGALLGLGALAALVGVIELISMALIVPAVAIISDPAALLHLPLPQGIIDALAGTPWRQSLLLLIGLLFAGYALKAAVQIVFYRWQTALAARWQGELAARLLRADLNAPYHLHVQRHSTELIRSISGLVHDTYGRFLNALLSLFADGAAAGALVLLSLVVAPMPALAAGTLMIVIYALQHRIFQRMHLRLGAESIELLNQEQTALQQSLGAFREMRVARREPFFLAEFTKLQERLRRNIFEYEFSRRLPPVFGEASMILCVTLAVLVLVLMVPQPGQVLIGLGLLAAVAFRLSPLANRIVGAIGIIENASAGLGLLASEIAAERARAGVSSAYATPIWFRNAIELKDVGLKFAGRDRPALQGINIRMARGEVIGVVGPSGAGKTTLIDILLGLLEPSEGLVLIDGEPAGPGRHANAGYVPQDIFLFDDTLRANIAFGVPAESVDDAQVRRLLSVVHLDGLLAQLPDGLDTRLGERGRLLSGGQRQRIGIARALYHAPELLVLDEATSSMDVHTEERVAEAIAALRGSVTIVVIAHRLSTVKNCDRIILLDEGRIADQGSFEDLNARNAAFKSMVRLATPGGTDTQAGRNADAEPQPKRDLQGSRRPAQRS